MQTILRSPGETEYGIYVKINGKLMLVVSEQDVNDIEEEEEKYV